MSDALAPATKKQTTFLGHPVGLYVLFFSEMWERFSYYGMRALLVLYMVNYFRWSQQQAASYYKMYTSLVYITPILGGFLADRYLGNRMAVVIGAILMAIGHFLMAFEEHSIFISALAFLIVGNGFFKPNISTQVGRLYPANDNRRDGAYTIFYMGINLGAFLSPLACGWLAENTVGGYHSGFTLAGVGMVLGLIMYLLGQPFIKEIADAAPSTAPESVSNPKPATGGSDRETPDAPEPARHGAPLTEAEVARQPSIFGSFSVLAMAVIALGGIACIGAGLWNLAQKLQSGAGFDAMFNAIMLLIGGASLFLILYVCTRVQGGLRDRVMAILMLGVFVIFFWAAFEQAGNVQNIWADQQSNRYVTETPPRPDPIPPAPKEDDDAPTDKANAPVKSQEGIGGRLVRIFREMVTLKEQRHAQAENDNRSWLNRLIDPVPTAWLQSVNALFIIVVAPIFAWVWLALDKRGLQPSIPMKMALGLAFMCIAMVFMLGAARQENQRTVTSWATELPPGIELAEGGKIAHETETGKETFHGGRILFNAAGKEIVLDGVLQENERDRIIEYSAPADYRKKVDELVKKSNEADAKFEGGGVAVTLDSIPAGFALKFAGLKKSVVAFDAEKKTLTAGSPLAEKEAKALRVAGGHPEFRSTIQNLWVESTKFRVNMIWLMWSYLFATFGELCLSPVGLSMVSKLAPAKFATMLMGVWLLTNSFGNFVAGSMGEIWGTIPPIDFFILAAAGVGGASFLLFVIVRLVTKTMHGVK